MTEPAGFTLVSHTLGGLPLVNHVLRRLRFDELLQRHLPPPDPRAQLPPSAALGVLTRNLVLARVPLYGLGEWAQAWVPALLGLRPEHLSDRRSGGPDEAELPLAVDLVEPQGVDTMAVGHVGTAEVCARLAGTTAARPGDRLRLIADLSQMHLIDPENDRVIR